MRYTHPVYIAWYTHPVYIAWYTLPGVHTQYTLPGTPTSVYRLSYTADLGILMRGEGALGSTLRLIRQMRRIEAFLLPKV